MNSRKKILALITGVITALLLIFYAYRDSEKATSFTQTKKPTAGAPTLIFW